MTHLRKVFLESPGEVLGNHGYQPDPGRVEYTEHGIVFYHYTHEANVEAILKTGLQARLPVVLAPPELEGCYFVEGFLEPLPQWVQDSPYFGDLGLEMNRQYLGNVLLRVVAPLDFPGLYVADYAHILEGKHVRRRGKEALGLGYLVMHGHEACQADVNSYIPAGDYRGGHVAPVVKVARKGKGVAVAPEHISICEVQPMEGSWNMPTAAHETGNDERVARLFVQETLSALRQEFRRVLHCLRQLDDEQLWQRPTPDVNSVGTIIVHLCGNFRQWFLHGIGGAEDVRNRPAEFMTDTAMPNAELQKQFDALVGQIDELLLQGIPASVLLEPRRIHGLEVTGLSAIYSTINHLEGHAVQIAYITHTLLGERYEPFWKPEITEQSG